jgi:ABC-2 type transport system permease protein
MRLTAVFRKTLREQMRDWASLSMVIVLCPFFVFLYWLMTGGGTTSYKVLVINQDRGAVVAGRGTVAAGDRIVEAMRAMKYASGAPMLRVGISADRAAAEARLRDRDAAALIVLPADFSRTLHKKELGLDSPGDPVIVAGDAGNPAYAVASVLVFTVLDAVSRDISGVRPPVSLKEEFVSGTEPRSEFEMYVPGLLVLSIILLIFTTALPLVREREDGTLRRLRVSRMTAFDLLGGVSLAQVVIGSLAVVITFASAALLGFHSRGPILAAVAVSILTVGSVIAVGLVTACFCKNATAVLTIGTLPFFLLMWFSGAAMPLPRVTLFAVGVRSFAVNDILPPTHAVTALNKILSLGVGLGGVVYELIMIASLTAIYFGLAVWIYRRTQLRKE